MKISLRYHLVIFFSTLFLSLTSSQGLTAHSIDNFSLNITHGTIKDFTQAFHKETGYQLVFTDTSYEDMQANGLFKNISYSKFLSRLLKEYNFATVIDDSNRVIAINIYGKSPEIEIASLIHTEKVNNPTIVVDNTSSAPSSNNEKEYQEYINNPESVDPTNGISFKQLREQALAAEQEIERIKNDPNFIDPFSGMTIGEQKKAAEEGEKQLQELLTSSKS